MEDWIRIFLNNYINGLYFPTVHLTDVIEILIITVIVYEIMLWIKNTKAWMLLKGMIMLGAFFLLAAIFKMHTILFVAKESIGVLAIAAVVVFQPELRRALEKLGEKNFLTNVTLLIKAKKISAFPMKPETGSCAHALRWAVSAQER